MLMTQVRGNREMHRRGHGSGRRQRRHPARGRVRLLQHTKVPGHLEPAQRFLVTVVSNSSSILAVSSDAS